MIPEQVVVLISDCGINKWRSGHGREGVHAYVVSFSMRSAEINWIGAEPPVK